jgi:type IV pilus assembly protein PilQ
MKSPMVEDLPMTFRLSRIALIALAMAPRISGAAELNVVTSIEVSASSDAAQVMIKGGKAPTFTVFRLSDPARVVIDLTGADVSAVRGPRDGKGPVLGVSAAQFSDEHTAVGRVIVAVAEEARYEVKTVGDNVVVAVRGEGRVDVAPAQVPQAKEAMVESSIPANPDVVASRLDEKTASHPGHRLNELKLDTRGEALALGLLTDGEVGTFEVLELANPPRLALDLFGFEKGLKTQKIGLNGLREVRFGKHDGKVRVVLEASEGERMPKYQVSRTSGGLEILLGGPAASAVAAAPQPSPAATETTPAAAAKATTIPKAVPAASPKIVVPPERVEPKPAAAERKAKLAAVRDVSFRGDEVKGKIVVSVPKGVEHRVSRPDPRTAVMTLSGVSLPKRLERSLDTSTFGGPVKMVSSFSTPGRSDAVQVVATLEGAATDRVIAGAGGQLIWEFATGKAASQAGPELVLDGQRMELQEESAVSSPQTGGFTSEASSYTASAGWRKSKYVGRRVSFEFKDIEIHNLLRIIADVSKRNIIVADNVSGKVTIRLRNVPWDQALDIILKSKGLDKEDLGNIIRVAPAKDLEEERKLAAERMKTKLALDPLKVRLIPVNYAPATEMSTKVKDVLTERGTMNVDARTNVIIVKDTAEALARAEGLIRRLDTQTPQVLIEGRIVEASTSFAREFGIQWGGNVSFAPATGNPTGLSFPNVVRMTGASSPEGSQGTADVPNFAVNLPAPIGAGAGGGVGFVFGSAGGAVALNLRLSAMESNGQIKTISAPKITTLDNTAATIGQGISIPFSQTSASGVNTTFVEAKLELKVTPHVTADGSVLLTINATNNQPNPGITGANGQPSISKKEAQTQVLVKDGDTTVIGGIYTRSQALNEAAVPVLSRIPVLGWLFKKKRETDDRTELLIFISPRIVNRNQVASAGDGPAH